MPIYNEVKGTYVPWGGPGTWGGGYGKGLIPSLLSFCSQTDAKKHGEETKASHTRHMHVRQLTKEKYRSLAGVYIVAGVCSHERFALLLLSTMCLVRAY